MPDRNTSPDAIDVLRLREQDIAAVYDICHRFLTTLDPNIYAEGYRRGAHAVCHAIGDHFGWH